MIKNIDFSHFFLVYHVMCILFYGRKKCHFRHKTGYGSEWEEEKPSKVQKVLHLSITALSFLAFAGYLLCMIVQAIKSKGVSKHEFNIYLKC